MKVQSHQFVHDLGISDVQLVMMIANTVSEDFQTWTPVYLYGVSEGQQTPHEPIFELGVTMVFRMTAGRRITETTVSSHKPIRALSFYLCRSADYSCISSSQEVPSLFILL